MWWRELHQGVYPVKILKLLTKVLYNIIILIHLYNTNTFFCNYRQAFLFGLLCYVLPNFNSFNQLICKKLFCFRSYSTLMQTENMTSNHNNSGYDSDDFM